MSAGDVTSPRWATGAGELDALRAENTQLRAENTKLLSFFRAMDEDGEIGRRSPLGRFLATIPGYEQVKPWEAGDEQ